MAFLNPLLLFGLIAAIIPIAIHFFGRRKPRRVAFGAIAFLEQVRRQQFQRLRFRNWLLLLLRTLAIVFIVLSFAKPAIRSGLAGIGYRGESAMVVLLDDGPSMGYEGTRGNRFDWAKSRLYELRSLAGSNDWAVIIRTSAPDLVLPLDENTITALDRPSTWSGSGSSALRHAAELLNRSGAANRELYILSDLAGPPWQAFDTIDWPAHTTAYLFLPPSESVTNLAIDSLSGGGELARSGLPFTVTAYVRNTGQTRIDDVPVALWIDGRRVQQRTVTVASNERIPIEFTVTLPTSRWVSGRVEIANDPLDIDNSRYFALSVPSETRITIVGEATQSREVLEAIFQSPNRESPYVLNLRSVTDVDRRAFETADVVIVNEHTDLGDQAVGWLHDAIRRGTGLLVLIGPETDLQQLDRRITSRVCSTRVVGLRSAGLRDSVSYFSVEHTRSPNPITMGVFGTRGSTEPRFADYAILRAPEHTVVTRFNTGDPWITLERSQNGAVALFAAGLNTAWTDLAYRGAVVPLMHRIVNNLARSVSLSHEYHVGPRNVNLELSSQMTAPVVVESPSGESRSATIATESGVPNVIIDAIDSPGIWTVRSGDRIVSLLAANIAAEESELASLNPTAFRERYGLPGLHEVRSDLRTYVESTRRGTELDTVFLALALMCIAAELLAMRGIRTDSQDAAGASGRQRRVRTKTVA